jgi:magnesium chelatase family protein
VTARVTAAIRMQRTRFSDLPFCRNAHIPPGLVDRFCCLDSDGRAVLRQAVEKYSLSSRALHSILKVARTIADLEASARVWSGHVMEAVQFRRYCEGDVYWSYE